ncbi:MAG: serine/threonine-protein kinase, partial [bacterium]
MTDTPSAASTARQSGLGIKLEGKRLADWIVEDYLAEGAFGVVHRARHAVTGELAALKIMKPEMVTLKRLERFQRESIVLGRVSHPNVVQFKGTGSGDVVGTPLFFIAMELLIGKTLEEEVRDRGRLPEKYVHWIGTQIVAALEAVAEHRIVHGDLKPSNVFLTDDGRVKVMDFGHATLLEFENVTQAGAFIGTAAFAAPEQFVDSSKVDALADQYSLGCLLYYLLSGSVPYPDARVWLDIAEAHQRSQTVPLRQRNPQVSAFSQMLVNRLMAKNKRDRFQRLADVGAVMTTREQSTFFYSALPEHHLRRDSSIFWSQIIFPRFP